jgi:hypothetical protein
MPASRYDIYTEQGSTFKLHLHYKYSGGTGYTGGIFIRADATTMKNTPYGKHFYDLELTNSLGEVQRLIEGSFEISREITR